MNTFTVLLSQFLFFVFFIDFNIMFTKKSKLLITIFIIISIVYIQNSVPNDVLDLSIGINIYILLFVCMYINNKSVVLSTMFLLFLNNVLSFIWTFTYDIPNKVSYNYKISFKVVAIQFLILIVIKFIVNEMNKRNFMENVVYLTNGKYRFFSICMGIFDCVLIISRPIFLILNNHFNYFLSTFLLFLCFIFFTIFILILNKNIENEIMLKVQSKNAIFLTNQIETSRDFRHDYKTFVYSIKSLIDNNDFYEAKLYMDSMVKESKIIMWINHYPVIEKISNSALQGVLLDTINYCDQNNINFILNVKKFPAYIDMDLFDFIRCFSLLINNAKEYCLSMVNVEIIGSSSELRITVENDCAGKVNVEKIFKRNYTTKQDHQGIGLYILKNTIKKYSNVEYFVETKRDVISFSIVISNVRNRLN